MTKNEIEKIKETLNEFGCLGVCVFFIVVLLMFLLLLAVNGLLFGCIIYSVWNWVVVPIAGVPVLTFFWQCFILGLVLTLALGVIKGIEMTVKRS